MRRVDPIFGVLLLAGISLGGFSLFAGAASILARYTWAPTPAVLVESTTQVFPHSRGGYAYELSLRYRYVFAGSEHFSTSFGVPAVRLDNRPSNHAAENWIAEHPAGAPLTVFVNRANPNQSAIETKLGIFHTVLFFGSFLLIFVGYLPFSPFFPPPLRLIRSVYGRLLPLAWGVFVMGVHFAAGEVSIAPWLTLAAYAYIFERLFQSLSLLD